MEEERKPLIIERQLRFIFIFTIVLMIGMGVYSLLTKSSTGGVLYGKFGGSTTVSYGAYGFFEMAAALVFGYILLKLFTPSKKTKK